MTILQECLYAAFWVWDPEHFKKQSQFYICEHSWAAASSEAAGMKSCALRVLLIQHVESPETLAVGHVAYAA